MKKSYNSFKMRGSYVYLIIFILTFSLLLIAAYNSPAHKHYIRECANYQKGGLEIMHICESDGAFECFFGFQSQSCTFTSKLIEITVFSLIIALPIFLIGWIIRSLIRWIKR